MKEIITLNSKEQKRLMVLNAVERGQVPPLVAAEVLGLVGRQPFRNGVVPRPQDVYNEAVSKGLGVYLAVLVVSSRSTH